jgi:hypothetical protein
VCGSIVKKATGACYGDQESASDALLAAADGDDLMLQIEQLIDPQALQMLTPEWEALGTAAATGSRIDVKRLIVLRPIKNQRRGASG